MRRFTPPAAVFCFALVMAALLSPGATNAQGEPATPPPNFRVAFLGDQAINANAVAVLQLIENEGADMVIHLGDMGYGNETDPQTAIDWDAQITSVLGADFPYFGVTGNHDVGDWTTYKQKLEARLALVPGASCSGDYGVMAACTYQGLFFILSGAGSQPITPDYAPHITYIQNQLAADSSIWRVCAWHKNQNAMQVGNKPNEVGWGPYEACRQGRAIIATAHEHSYHRTRTLINTQTQTVDPTWPDAGTLRVGAGATFVFVAGLGGNSIRNQDRCLPASYPYGCNGEWASIYTSNQGANYGALFIDFHVDGNPRKARGYFKDIDGDVIDTFTVFSDFAVGGVTEPVGAQPAPAADSSTTSGDARWRNPVLAAAVAVLLATLLLALGAAARLRRRA